MTSSLGLSLDFWPYAEQNGASKNSTDEVRVAKIDEVESRLDKRITHLTYGGWAVILILLSWLGTGTGFLVSMSGDIRAIKQAEKDHGIEIANSIENPRSIEDLTANLTLAAAQLRVARTENRKPNNERVKSLQDALVVASKQHADIPETWSAAAQLISFRSHAASVPTRPLPPCFTSSAVEFHSDQPHSEGEKLIYISMIEAEDCTLDLSDGESFLAKTGKAIAKIEGEVSPQNPILTLVLKNVHVIYRGGPLLPKVDGYIFQNCMFDWELPSVPPPPGRKITQNLLEAQNFTDVRVQGL